MPHLKGFGVFRADATAAPAGKAGARPSPPSPIAGGKPIFHGRGRQRRKDGSFPFALRLTGKRRPGGGGFNEGGLSLRVGILGINPEHQHPDE